MIFVRFQNRDERNQFFIDEIHSQFIKRRYNIQFEYVFVFIDSN